MERSQVAEHDCKFPDVEILEADEGDILQKGAHVLGPCPECGETPFDHLDFLENRAKELEAALIAVQPYRPMYHWSPRERKKQIIRYGLRPHMRPTTTDSDDRRIPYVCFADSPSWAWALSGEQRRFPVGTEWDLWMTWLSDIPEPIVHATPDRPSGLYEVRTEHRIYKSKLWYVGSRIK